MSDSAPKSDPEGTSAPLCRIAVAGNTIESLVRGRDGFGNYAEVVAAYPSLDDWPADAPSADLLVIGIPSMFPQTIETIQGHLSATGAGRAIVVYEFSNAETEAVARKPASRVTPLRAPVTAAELRSACEADIALASIRDHWAESGEALKVNDLDAEMEAQPNGVPDLGNDPIPARTFSDSQLARIARISTTIECECPHHLAALLNSLNAFEDYSLNCENRSAEDALLHGYLHRSTAKARATIEEALVVLVEAEGIEID